MTLSNRLIELKNISFRYPGTEEYILKNLSLSIEEGDFVAIIGGNGSGKSTACKVMNGLIPHFYVGEFEGEAFVNNDLTSNHDVAHLSQYIGYVYQDFENQLLRPTVLDDASFMPLNYGIQDYLERGKWALEVTGLSELADRFVWQLSGGQKHLLALAGAIAMKPKILIVDEPIAQLDPYHATKIYNVLKLLNEQYQMTIIVIEHHAEFIANYCKQVILLDQGAVSWKKNVHDALNEVEALIARKIYPPQVTMAAHLLQLPKPYPITITEAERYFSVPTIDFSQPKERLHPQKPSVMSLENISVNYRLSLKKKALHQINIDFREHDCIALVGNNGAGKSTLLKVLTGIVKPQDGVIKLGNEICQKVTPEGMANHIAYVFQNPEEMFIDDSVRKEIEYYLKAREIEDLDNVVDKLLADFHLEALQDKDARLLSGGQQRRVSLAIGAAMCPEIMILDEPTANLDIATKETVITMLEKLQQYVKTIIIATHDMTLVAEWANRILVLHDGELIADGSSDHVFRNNDILEMANIDPPQIAKLSERLKMPYCGTLSQFIAYWVQFNKRGDSIGHDQSVSRKIIT